MKGEIGRDFYCSALAYDNLFCKIKGRTCDGNVCKCYHCKHPTPEQYKQEYDEEYPDDAAIYVFDDDGFDDNGNKGFWNILDLDTLRQESGRYIDNEIVICACTPFGKPDDDWRQKNE